MTRNEAAILPGLPAGVTEPHTTPVQKTLPGQSSAPSLALHDLPHAGGGLLFQQDVN